MLTELLGDETEDEPAVDIVRAAIAEMTELGAEAVDVEIPQLQELRQGASVIHTEFKFDLMDYLESVPDAPVASLAEILERGLLHAALERGFRRRDELEGRDTEAHRAALVKRDALQRAVLAVLDEHALDALVYPTLRRQAARIGEPQRGGNCSLSAMSGLPAITVPAGFTDDGMPIGLELLGRPFSDPELVGFAFAFEQATHHRGAPATTPAAGQRRGAARRGLRDHGDRRSAGAACVDASHRAGSVRLTSSSASCGTRSAWTGWSPTS